MGDDTYSECKHGVAVFTTPEVKRQCAMCTAEAHRNLHDRIVNMLRRLDRVNGRCPVCKVYVPYDHAPNCELDALLSEVGREG